VVNVNPLTFYPLIPTLGMFNFIGLFLLVIFYAWSAHLMISRRKELLQIVSESSDFQHGPEKQEALSNLKRNSRNLYLAGLLNVFSIVVLFLNIVLFVILGDLFVHCFPCYNFGLYTINLTGVFKILTIPITPPQSPLSLSKSGSGK